MREEDLALASRCIAGDRSAQRDLFRRQRDHVHATLYRVLGSNVDMEDLAQEAFVEIFKSLRNFRGEAQLSTWIDRITVRVAYAYLSKRKRLPPRLEVVDDVASGDASAEQRAAAREVARRLYAVLDRLEARQRTAFALHVIDGRPLKEVAEVMEASLTATKVRVWRARREIEKRARHDALLAPYVRGEAG